MKITIKKVFLFQALGIIVFSLKKTYDLVKRQMSSNSLGPKPPLYKSQYKFFNVNNLKCLHIKNTKLKKSYVSVGVDCGSQYDTSPGLAHLLEHLLFISPEANTSKDRNVFNSFLSKYNGGSNAFTSDHMTVYHYEIDTVGLSESLKMFSNFFKNPQIEEFSIESEIKNVDSEFQMVKYHEDWRIWRLQEILENKAFLIGNLNTLGTDNSKLKKELDVLHDKYYKKMALVICSHLDFDEIESLTRAHFTLPLNEIQYENRKCAYCDTQKKPDNQFLLKINKLIKLKGLSSKKSIFIIIPLISKYNLPLNIYEPILYFLTKSGYDSYVADLKRKKLAISVSNRLMSLADRDMLSINITVEDTNKYDQILQITQRYLKDYLNNHKKIFEECQSISKIKWEKKEDPSPRTHVIECIRSILKCNTLFTSQLFQHDCPNISLEKCYVVLVDKNFDIQEKRDEYELQYEELPPKGGVEGLVLDGWSEIQELHPDGTKTFIDDTNQSKLQTLTYRNSRFVVVSDKFDTPDIFIKLILRFDCTLNDKIGFKIFYENIKYVCASLLEMNGISFNGSATNEGITFNISGRDPLFILMFIMLRANPNLLDQKLVIQDLYNKKIKKKHAHGFLRVSEEIQNLYLEHSLDLDSEISHLKAILDDKIALDESVGFFEKITQIDMVIGGAHSIGTYYDCFKKMVDALRTDSTNNNISLVNKFIINRPIKDMTASNDLLLSNSIIRAAKTIRAKNKATSLFFRIGKGISNISITRAMVNSLHEKFFHKLRTDKSLGYVVRVSYSTIKGECFVSFSVQSQKDVLAEIIEYINQSEFTLGDIQSIINEIITEKLCRKDLINLYGTILTNGVELKNWAEELSAELKRVTPQRLKRALQNAEITLVQSEEFE